jgi:hypothetical protein
MSVTADLIRSYRTEIARNPELYDGNLDVVSWLINDTAGRTWTPSEIGQAVGIDTVEARRLLVELVELGAIRSDDRGAWTRYYGARA